MKKIEEKESIEKQADDNQHQISGASEEEFLEYVFTTLGRREWLKGAM